jgi:hypothetical protein
MPKCKICNKHGLFLRLNDDGLCKQCEYDLKTDKEKLLDKLKSSIRIEPAYVGTSTGGNTRRDYYVYEWKTKETGEIFYVGKGRGNRAYEKHERAYETKKIKEKYDTEVIIVKDNLTEEEALQFENDEMLRILNETTHRLTNRITPIGADRSNGYDRAPSAPVYEFEKASVLFACEIEEHYHGIQHRNFDEVELKFLSKPHFIDKSLFGEEVKIVYGNNYNKYLNEVKFWLEIYGSNIAKTKFAISVSCWVYSVDDYVLNYKIDCTKAEERIGHTVPCYHLIDVWKFLKNIYGNEEIKQSDPIIVNPIHHRVPLDEIKNLNNDDKGFDEGFPFLEKADKLRKNGQIDEALNYLDEARYRGYNAPALYNSYAILFRKNKEYDDEIAILQEGLTRVDNYGSSRSKVISKWTDRIEKAKQLKEKQ